MQEQEFKALLEKHTAGKCTEEEIAWLENAYLKWNDTEQVRLGVEQMQTAQNVMWPIVERETKPIVDGEDRPVRRIRMWPLIAGVAAAVALIVFGMWFFSAPRLLDRRATRDLYANDIAPGSNKATLTLANGKVINLSYAKTGVIIDASELTYNDGTAVERGDPGLRQDDGKGSNDGRVQTLTANTPRGGTYQITLPDGTRVWLNADSKISFPSQFSGDKRKVLLSGEAYFEVTKNKKKPFIVESRKQTVEVLGTHFNINSYADEQAIKTTLLEGAVRVVPNSGLRGITLKPNQQAILTNNINILPIDARSEIAWKNGDFNFNDESIQDVMKVLTRWYNIEVSYQGNITRDRFNAKISRFRNLSQVLSKLEETDLVHFEIDGRRVIVKE
jgi:transmembrane sensor